MMFKNLGLGLTNKGGNNMSHEDFMKVVAFMQVAEKEVVTEEEVMEITEEVVETVVEEDTVVFATWVNDGYNRIWSK